MRAGACIAAMLMLLMACQQDNAAQSDIAAPPAPRPDIIATNAFYYYADIDRAWAFYQDTLGLETVVDYGFAKILRLADTSYLTLVQADSGMHSTDEPKTVTLNLITDTLDSWHALLSASDVDLRMEYEAGDGRQGSSFVVADPEGYLIRFVRFNPHPRHPDYVTAFTGVDTLAASAASELNVRATAFSVYFADAGTVRDFYEGLFSVSPVGEFKGHSLYQMSSSGFVVLVDGGDELHQATDENGVTLSFLTTDIDAWFARATSWQGFELRTPEILNEGGLVRVFVGYDPSGIFLEWDTFLDVEENVRLMRQLEN